MEIHQDILNWLLEEKNPSVHYRTIKDLFGVQLSKQEKQTYKQAILASKPVQKILKKMHPEGYWLYRGQGKGVGYAMSSSTHFVLSYLAELGLDRSDAVIEKAVARYLSLSEPDVAENPAPYQIPPDYANHQSCLYAHNLRTFVLLGYRQDERIQIRIDTLLADVRHDDGYLCQRPAFTETTKSCIRGTVKALMAFAELPEYYQADSCQRVVNYFLKRNIYFKSTNLNEKIRGGMRTVFPFVINTSLLEPLYALSKMGYGKYAQVTDAWKTLESRKTDEGKYILDWHPSPVFNPGKKGTPNKWATLYAYLALKEREQVDMNRYRIDY